MRNLETRITCHLGWLFWSVMIIAIMTEPIDAANDLAEKKEALDVIADFAVKVCKDIPLTGGEKEYELSGEASAELNGLIKKLVNLGIKGTAKYKKSKYEGVLREDLVKALKNSADCKLEVFRELKSQLLGEGHSDDDQLEIVSYDEEGFRDFWERRGNTPEMVAALVTAAVMGVFIKDVVRHGKPGKTYRKNIEMTGGEILATPYSKYLDEQSRTLKKVSVRSRSGESGAFNVQEWTFVSKEGVWMPID